MSKDLDCKKLKIFQNFKIKNVFRKPKYSFRHTNLQANLLTLQIVKGVPYQQLDNLVNRLASNWIRQYLLFSSSLIFKTDLD